MTSFDWPIVAEAVDEEKLIRLRIEADDNGENPRTDYDHIATMMCAHDRYNLGDIQIKSEYRQHMYSHIAAHDDIRVLCAVCDEEVDENAYSEGWSHNSYQCEFEGHTARFSGEFTFHCMTHDVYVSADQEPDECAKAHEVTEVKLSEEVYHMPLYLYDHSGITMSTSNALFSSIDSAGWDWGCVGFIYVTKAKIMESYGLLDNDEDEIKAKALELMQSEVKEYDQYLTGDVYGFTLEKGKRCSEDDVHWEVEESCWGFYGSDHEASGLKDNLPSEYHYLLEEL
jgi:hypothetical protein